MNILEAIKETTMPAHGVVVITVRRADQYTLRPFTTFARDNAGTVLVTADFVTLAAALFRHEQLVK